MKCKWLLAFCFAMALPTAALAGNQSRVERTQLPPPFGPGPIIPGPQQCSPTYQSLLKMQIEGLKRIKRLSRNQGETLCATLEGADQLGVGKFIDPKLLEPLLTPQQRELLEALGLDLSKVNVARLMRLLGIDVSQLDLRKLKDQCRQSQGELGRFVANELNRLENEMLRCDDRV